MSFSDSQKRRFYQVYHQDALTTVGRFKVVGSLVSQHSMFHSNSGEIIEVVESRQGQHAEQRFLKEHVMKGITLEASLRDSEVPTLKFSTKITYSPCTMCCAQLTKFLDSLPKHVNSKYSLCIQFANLYYNGRRNADDVINQLATWARSLKKMGVHTTFEPLRVTEDPEFDPTPLGISAEKQRERKSKDNKVSVHVEQLMKIIQEEDTLITEFEKMRLKPSASPSTEVSPL